MPGRVPVIVVIEFETFPGARVARDEAGVEVDHLVPLRGGFLDESVAHEVEISPLPGARGVSGAKPVQGKQHALCRQPNAFWQIATDGYIEAMGERSGFSTTVDFKLPGHVWSNDTRQSTQEAVEVQEFFAELLVAGGTWGVLEATSHALALRKLRGCEVDIAVFTNLSPEHLDFHGTLQRYLETKGQLFVMLPGSADKGVAKTAVLNADDPHWRYLADRAEGARVMTYGIDAHADVQGTVLSADAAGSKVRIATEGGSIELMLPPQWHKFPRSCLRVTLERKAKCFVSRRARTIL